MFVHPKPAVLLLDTRAQPDMARVGQASRCSLRPNHPEAGCCFTSINQNTALHFALGVGVSVGAGHLRDTNSEQQQAFSSLRLRNGHLSKQYVELYIDGSCQAPPGNRALLLVMRTIRCRSEMLVLTNSARFCL